MAQQDMAWETFTAIVDAIAQPGSTVSLQGEGEPTLHPHFWDMARYVRQRGHQPYSIVNGSRIDARRIAGLFTQIGISIDTLDPATAEQIGRHNLPKVLTNLEDLCTAMGPKRIVVMTVDLGQPLAELKAWVAQRGFGRHVVQPLMRKTDYAVGYPQHLPQSTVLPPVRLQSPVSARAVNQPLTCQFLHQNIMRYHTVQGMALPCCFIKNTSGIESIEHLRNQLAHGNTPIGCLGCSELRPVAAQTTPLERAVP